MCCNDSGTFRMKKLKRSGPSKCDAQEISAATTITIDYCILLYIHSACVLDRGRNRRNLNSWDLVTACSTAFYTTFYTVFPQCPRLCSSITSCLLRLFVSSAILVLRYHWWDCSKLQLGVLCQVQANKRKKHESCSMLQLKGEEEIGNLSRFWFLHCIRSGGNRDPPNLKGSRGNNMEALRHKGKYRSVRWFKFNELKPILTFISS